MKTLCLTWLAFSFVASGGLAGVLVKLPAIHLDETTSTTKSQTTITGPRGTKKIQSNEISTTTNLPGSTETETDSHTDISGVSDPGIRLERKSYYRNSDGKLDAVPNPEVTGGPGSVDVKTYKRTTIRPMYSH